MAAAKAKGSRVGGRSAPPKIVRWTDLLASLLRNRYAISFEQIAREVPGYGAGEKDRASVKRMFERDKKELLRFGVPIETVLDEKGEPTLYTVARTNFYLPYLGLLDAARRPSPPRRGKVGREGYRMLQALAFEPDELAAVAEAAARVRALGDPGVAADADSAMRKLAYDLPVGATAAERAPHVVPARAQPDPAAFAVLDEALRDRKVVTFDYRSMGSDRTAARTVEPYGLFYLHGHWYLAGRDRDAGDLRNFRLSRMSGVRRNTARESTPDYEVPPGFRLREHARSRQAWELGDGDAREVDVRFVRDTGAAAAAARLGAPVEGAPDRRRFTVRRQDAFVRWLLAFAGDARPVAPADVVAEFDAQLRATLALYRAGA